MKTADLHCDTMSEIYKNRIRGGQEIRLRRNHLHVDLLKLKKGNYLLQNFAIFIDLHIYQNPLESCIEMIDLYYEELQKNQDFILPAFTYADILRHEKNGRMSAFLTIEEGGAVKGSLSFLRTMYRLGVRMMTLTWNYGNEIGCPNAPDSLPLREKYTVYDSRNGLSGFGRDCVLEMEGLGMIIDVSHLSDAGFWDVVKYTKKPFTASHSNARSICSHARNMSDTMIRALAERGGVIGVCWHPAFLKQPEQGKEAEIAAGISHIVSHIKHIYRVAGYECIGFGSDFDGMDPNMDMADASCLPMLEDALWKAGFGKEQIEAIFYKNILKMYKEILK